MSRLERITEMLMRFWHPRTTVQVRAAQTEHHKLAQGEVKRIFPYDKVREYTRLYKILDETNQFGIIAAYLRICVLNETERQDWSYFQEEAMRDQRLSEADKDIFTELVSDLKARSRRLSNGEVVLTPTESKAAFDELLAWKISERSPEELAALVEDDEAETQAWLSLQSLGILMEREAEAERDEAERKRIAEIQKLYIPPDEYRSYILALNELDLRQLDKELSHDAS